MTYTVIFPLCIQGLSYSNDPTQRTFSPHTVCLSTPPLPPPLPACLPRSRPSSLLISCCLCYHASCGMCDSMVPALIAPRPWQYSASKAHEFAHEEDGGGTGSLGGRDGSEGESVAYESTALNTAPAQDSRASPLSAASPRQKPSRRFGPIITYREHDRGRPVIEAHHRTRRSASRDRVDRDPQERVQHDKFRRPPASVPKPPPLDRSRGGLSTSTLPAQLPPSSETGPSPLVTSPTAQRDEALRIRARVRETERLKQVTSIALSRASWVFNLFSSLSHEHFHILLLCLNRRIHEDHREPEALLLKHRRSKEFRVPGGRRQKIFESILPPTTVCRRELCQKNKYQAVCALFTCQGV